MKKSQALLILLVILFGLNLSFSYAQNSFYHNIRFHHLDSDDGLPTNTIWQILQDKYGFMWFGTTGGLVRYDGYKTTLYAFDPEDSTSLSDNSVFAMVEDNDGNIWCGNRRKGISMLNRKSGKFTRYKNIPDDSTSLNNDDVRAICKDNYGNIWVATVAGLNKFDVKENKFIRYDSGENVPTNIFGIFSDNDEGKIWVCGFDFGVWIFDVKTEKFANYLYNPDDPNSFGSISSFTACKDQNGIIWIGTANGLNSFDYTTDKFTRYTSVASDAKTISGNYFWRGDVFVDRENNLWAGTEESGLNLFNRADTNFTRIVNRANDPYSISSNHIYSIFQDRSGLIWIGTDGGINIFDKKTAAISLLYHIQNSPGSLSGNDVMAIFQDSKKQLWVSTNDAGIDVFDSSLQKIYNYNQNDATLPHNGAAGIVEDINGVIWQAGFWGCIGQLNLKTNRFEKIDTLCQNYNCIYTDKNKNIWIGTNGGGIHSLSGKKYLTKSYISNRDDSTTLSHAYVMCVFESHDGTIWVGTFEGLNAINPVTGICRRYYADSKTKNSLTNNTILSIAEDQNGIMWIGTLTGLNSLNRENNTIKQYYKKNGLPSDLISKIVIDNENIIWLATNSGLCRFDPETESFFTFDVTDGIPSNQIDYGYLAPNGKLYFGTPGGVFSFFPADLEKNERKPEVIISMFTILNKTTIFPEDLNVSKEITLSYLEYFFTLEFAALDFSAPEKNQYAYKLEGFNKDWVYLGNKRDVTFTNLDAGEYSLMVKASNNHNIWSDEIEILKIIITPPWWKTTWFRVLIIILIVSLIFFYIKWRERKLKKEKKSLENKINLATTEIRKQKEFIEEKNHEITDSITYAKRIQDAILPPETEIKKHLPDSFILYKPKDIVAGDFYWLESCAKASDSEGNNTTLFAAADCTGHGVPGAMVSVICHGALTRAVREFNLTEPGKILEKVRDLVIETFEKSKTEVKDGMDIALCSLSVSEMELNFAGANNPLYIIRNGELFETKADKHPIGKHVVMKPFKTHKLKLEKGDTIYIFTDGFADQFGGENGKKFKSSAMKDLLLSIQDKTLDEQKEQINQIFENWKGKFEQIDDVCVFGVRV